MIQNAEVKYKKRLEDYLDCEESYADMEIPNLKYVKRDENEVEEFECDKTKKLGFIRYLGSSKTSREKALVEGWLQDVEFYSNILDNKHNLKVQPETSTYGEKLDKLHEEKNTDGDDDFEFDESPLQLSVSKLDKGVYLNTSLSTFSQSIGSLDSVSEREDFSDDLIIPDSMKKLSLKVSYVADDEEEQDDMEDGLELPDTLNLKSFNENSAPNDPIKTAFVNSNAHTSHQKTPERFNNFKDSRFWNENEFNYTGDELDGIEIPEDSFDLSEFEEKVNIRNRARGKSGGPTLLKSFINAPKIVNNMTFNLQKKSWEGNDDVLKQFDLKKETILSNKVEDHESMAFDPITMTWKHKKETSDIFADIPDIIVQQEIVDNSAFVVFPNVWDSSDKQHKRWARNYFSMQAFRPATFKSGVRGNFLKLQ